MQKLKIFLLLIKYIRIVKYFALTNYRSTKNILETALALISNNSSRVGKNYGLLLIRELVKLNCYRNGKEEAQGISDILEQELKKIFFKRCINIS